MSTSPSELPVPAPARVTGRGRRARSAAAPRRFFDEISAIEIGEQDDGTTFLKLGLDALPKTLSMRFG